MNVEGVWQVNVWLHIYMSFLLHECVWLVGVWAYECVWTNEDVDGLNEDAHGYSSLFFNLHNINPAIL